MKSLMLVFWSVVLICFLCVRYSKHCDRVEAAKKDYKKALASGNKSDALAKGRIYYSLQRWGKLSIYDEQAISNDLSTMS